MDEKPVDVEQFKVGMRTLAGAVNIITSVNANHRYGMTATAVCSATADPPTVLACINKLASTHGAVAKSKAFCVNVLRAEDWELSTMFSRAHEPGHIPRHLLCARGGHRPGHGRRRVPLREPPTRDRRAGVWRALRPHRQAPFADPVRGGDGARAAVLPARRRPSQPLRLEP